jgi:hypothetical protein
MSEALKERLKRLPPEEMVSQALRGLPGSAEECKAACDILKELGPPHSVEPLFTLYLGWKPQERDTGYQAFDGTTRDADQAASALLQAAGLRELRKRMPPEKLDPLLLGGPALWRLPIDRRAIRHIR